MSTRITPEHEDYQDIHAAWVLNNRPSQFDRQGDFGGAVYRCYNRSAEEPDFYVWYSDGPTELNEKGKVVKEGWYTVNQRYMHMRAGVDRHGRFWVKRPEFP